MRANCSSSSACSANSSEEELPGGLETPGNLQLVFTVVTAVMMGLLMFSLGCSVEVQKLWSHLRRPWGIAVGLLCQFGLMPLTAYVLAISFSLKPIQAITVLIMGCCPGGTISNVFTFWVDGDMDLRHKIFANPYDLVHLKFFVTQQQSQEEWLGITLVCLAIPVAFGVYVNYRWPKQSKIILKIGAVVGGILLLVVTVAGVVLAKGFWNSDTTFLIISFIFPLVGHVAGFLLALLTHQSWQRCRTISLETGAQNIQMCITMLQLSFASENLVQMFNFPLAYGLFQMLDGFLIVAAYRAYKRRLKKKGRRKPPDCAAVCHDKKPKETGAFLEANEEAGGSPGPSEPIFYHRALEPIGQITSCD
ncbi:PREDICTED: solute carrier family 10 member 6 [Dipodomys ordii]|uniref:Solute carrier family 10 member 6 n=1 Tax=Dipodomys ordii TaxID=10020 RepID=A0A1S3G8W9_DIPOR|nr:PREDICTED: solute carrier family 10 member 6 [Dipodomys ordii]